MNVKQLQKTGMIQKKAQPVTEDELNREMAYYRADRVVRMLLEHGYISEEESEILMQKNLQKIVPFYRKSWGEIVDIAGL